MKIEFIEDVDGKVCDKGTDFADATVHLNLTHLASPAGMVSLSGIWAHVTNSDMDVTGDVVVYTFRVPTNWKSASNLTIKTVWVNALAQDANEKIGIKMYVYASADGELANAAAVETVVDNTSHIGSLTEQYRFHYVDLIVTGANFAVDDEIKLRIGRDNVGDGGYCDGAVYLARLTPAYTANRLGEI